MTLFGPSGNSQNFFDAGHNTSEESAKWVKDMGLDAFEYPFGHGVTLSEEKAFCIGAAFKENGIVLSAHAPYFINFSNPDEEKISNSVKYVLQTANILRIMGGKRIIFHPASQGKDTRENAFFRAKENFKRLTDAIYSSGFEDMIFCPETMGKMAQIGTVEEITELCKTDKIYIPTVDFGHVNSREQGSLKCESDFVSRLSYMTEQLGRDKMSRFHVHFSKIEYSCKGEVRHLNFDDEKYGPDYEPFIDSIIKLDLKPTVICESAGNQDKDALRMKEYYSEKLGSQNLL